MACCAFAAFLVSQIVFALMELRERFLGAPDPARASAARNLAAAWRLGDPEPAVAPARSPIPSALPSRWARARSRSGSPSRW